jgi:hypothetical protein
MTSASPYSLANGSTTIVGVLSPCNTGNFIVTAAQTGEKDGNANGYLACRLADV